ncbi:hypothetical protein [Slackia isoflavoniconvertens]|uniref:hypothetical protein n=1 Tax=Slackia isoflavoniconvertens TaxID=572010 RepID=UPI003AB1E613
MMNADRADSCDGGDCALSLTSFGACSMLRALSRWECVKRYEHLTGAGVKARAHLKLAHENAKNSGKSLIKM